MESGDTVQAVSKALVILEILSGAPPCGVSELARALDCQKSTAFRLLNTLKTEGYVIQDPETEKYSLTLKLFRIGTKIMNNLDINTAALPVITRLAQASSETIHLCAMDNNQLVYLQKIESTYGLKVTMMSRIGQSTPFYCTGVGKVLLAYQTPEYIKSYLKETKLEQYTDKTITKTAELWTELERIRTAGIAYDNEEHELGVRCVAAPIFNQTGGIIAALSISGPTVRLVERELERMRKLVKESALEISREMGYFKNTAPEA
ncbi:IclR family transcriptional regulator [Spirochaetia bacterium]|nr:IclR family transcriptional regulator [Spirochaetia bacterium]